MQKPRFVHRALGILFLICGRVKPYFEEGLRPTGNHSIPCLGMHREHIAVFPKIHQTRFPMYMFNITIISYYVVTPMKICSLVVEGDLAPPTEGSHDSHVIKQEEEEEEDEGWCARLSLIPSALSFLHTTQVRSTRMRRRWRREVGKERGRKKES